jgi:hypothetical protein
MDGVVRAHLHVNAQDGFAEVAKHIKAMIAKFEAELVLAPGVEAAVTFVASRISRVLVQFLAVNLWMDFKRDHENSPLR